MNTQEHFRSKMTTVLDARTPFYQFVKGYIEAMLWTNEDEEGLEDATVWDFDPDAFEKIFDDCAKFFHPANLYYMQEAINKIHGISFEKAGQDFWLTRNGHGCGFWDGDWPDFEGYRLTVESQKFGDFTILATDDGKIDYL